MYKRSARSVHILRTTPQVKDRKRGSTICRAKRVGDSQ
jgi:hypothetical protein